MTPEERLVVLEGLLAKVRQTANERGLGLPQDLPPGIFRASRTSVRAPALTAFSEATSGTHRPLALVAAPPPQSPPLSRPEVIERDRPVPSGPLIEFHNAFDDEVTADGNPEEIEALVLAQLEAEKEAQVNGARAHPRSPVPAPVRPAEQSGVSRLAALAPGPPSPLPAKSPLSVRPPLMVATSSAPPPRPERISSLPVRASSPPSVPLELDDLDGLDFPRAPTFVVPKLPPPIQAPHESSVPPPTPAERVASPSSLPAPSPPAVESKATPSDAPDEPSLLDDADVASTSAPPPPAPFPPFNGVVCGSAEPAMAPPDADASASAEEGPATVLVLPEDDAAPDSVPESQRQMRKEERPLDDALDGLSDAPPESGEVESQRYAAKAHEEPPGFDESPTPRPSYDVTAELHAIGTVDVVDRPAPTRVEVAMFHGRVAQGRPSFGELLDAALDLGRPKS